MTEITNSKTSRVRENSMGDTSVFSVVGLLLGSGVVSSSLTLLGNAYVARRTDARRSRKAQSYSAMRIAVCLEEFAGQCAEIIDTYSMHDEPFGGPSTMPDFPTFTTDIEWRELDVALAGAALSLENSVRLANHSLNGSSFKFGREVAEAECVDHCAELGHAAWELAERLRKQMGLDRSVEQLPWNYGLALAREAARVRAHRTKIRQLPVAEASEISPSGSNAS